MYSIECKKITLKDCDFIASGEGAQDTKYVMYQHLESAHTDVITSMIQEQQTNHLDELLDKQLARTYDAGE